FAKTVQARAQSLAQNSSRPVSAKGCELEPLSCRYDQYGYHYSFVDVVFDRGARTAAITVKGPAGAQPGSVEEIHRAGSSWWPVPMARELDDAALMLRTNEPELGLWLLKTAGEVSAVLEMDSVLLKFRPDWLVRETIGLLRRTFARLDVSSRSMFAIIESG